MISNTDRFRPNITPTPRRLEGKVALITGGAKGIGRAIAIRFAQEGANIVLADICTPSGASAVREIQALGRECRFHRTDVSRRGDVQSAVDTAIEDFSFIDILVNNAGTVIFGSILDCSIEDWKRMLEVDLTGALHCTQIVAQHMREKNRTGRMIHIGSTASLLPTAQQGAYSVAKAGLRMVSRMAAMELAPFGITSNLLCPQGAVTDINRDLLSNPEVLARLESRIPLGRMATTQEIAAVASFLASDEAAYITGAEIVHDGGVTISPLWWR